MNHLLELCKIFHIKINDLVHEDFLDIASLGEDMKMKIVEFKSNQQRKMKILSRIFSFVP